uniref:MYND finger protein n=1 Tax=Pithovirus LCPAC401 TaxID=2506595 RepID=A0A481Z906_9VIRU|nr:MAG: MYND finger protein [Pithovirus LCPAC401]
MASELKCYCKRSVYTKCQKCGKFKYCSKKCRKKYKNRHLKVCFSRRCEIQSEENKCEIENEFHVRQLNKAVKKYVSQVHSILCKILHTSGKEASTSMTVCHVTGNVTRIPDFPAFENKVNYITTVFIFNKAFPDGTFYLCALDNDVMYKNGKKYECNSDNFINKRYNNHDLSSKRSFTCDLVELEKPNYITVDLWLGYIKDNMIVKRIGFSRTSELIYEDLNIYEKCIESVTSEISNEVKTVKREYYSSDEEEEFILKDYSSDSDVPSDYDIFC